MDKIYVLISPVKNEESKIEKTIECVMNQSILPRKWIIVDDGSTDNTPAIIEKIASKVDFIEVITRNKDEKRNYGSRVDAVNFGYHNLKKDNYDYLGILDADILIQNNYYELILNKFNENTKLGIAGGLVFDVGLSDGGGNRANDLTHVAGGVQMFRKQCFLDIEGYRPMPWGGDDFVAETMARMNGWEAKTFAEIRVSHLRLTGEGETKYWSQFRFREGLRDYSIGYHPLYHLLKCVNRVKIQPVFFGSIIREIGYVWASLRYRKSYTGEGHKKFVRQEQKDKIKEKLSNYKVFRWLA